MSKGLIIACWVLLVGLFGYQFGKHRAESYSQLIKRPIFPCGDAGCDFETAQWEYGWNATQETIDEFRHCPTIYFQREDEHATDFFKRLPKPLTNACVVMRKKPQPPLTYPSMEGVRNVRFIGGTTDGNLKDRRP